MRFPRRSLLLLALASTLLIPTFAENALSEDDLFEASLVTLEGFMAAGKNSDAQTAAKLFLDYDRYPPRAINRCRQLIKKNHELFSQYISIADDIYGYEIKRTPLGTRLLVEGSVTSSGDDYSEYSARFIYKNKRWRLIEIDLD